MNLNVNLLLHRAQGKFTSFFNILGCNNRVRIICLTFVSISFDKMTTLTLKYTCKMCS